MEFRYLHIFCRLNHIHLKQNLDCKENILWSSHLIVEQSPGQVRHTASRRRWDVEAGGRSRCRCSRCYRSSRWERSWCSQLHQYVSNNFKKLDSLTLRLIIFYFYKTVLLFGTFDVGKWLTPVPLLLLTRDRWLVPFPFAESDEVEEEVEPATVTFHKSSLHGNCTKKIDRFTNGDLCFLAN